MRKRTKSKVSKKTRAKAGSKARPKRKAHAPLKEMQDWMRRGERLFAVLLAKGGSVSRSMQKKMHKGLVRLKGQTDRMVESWEQEIAERLTGKRR